ncbi:SMC5-SMC6 complex localization factor protein 2 [Polypterus senegalus]|uniref:SMC5-SMC6 complex localization factor protein 2 n=1 Tax=Polypterus senegalus TaxID=55291 RepID=UPI001962E18E|nr:SMC5-SMC6 complex localization factor protein 2 [Polypterus senegalus]
MKDRKLLGLSGSNQVITDFFRPSNSPVKERAVLESPKSCNNEAKESKHTSLISLPKMASEYTSNRTPVKSRRRPSLMKQTTPSKSPILEAFGKTVKLQKTEDMDCKVANVTCKYSMPCVVVKKLFMTDPLTTIKVEKNDSVASCLSNKKEEVSKPSHAALHRNKNNKNTESELANGDSTRKNSFGNKDNNFSCVKTRRSSDLRFLETSDKSSRKQLQGSQSSTFQVSLKSYLKEREQRKKKQEQKHRDRANSCSPHSLNSFCISNENASWEDNKLHSNSLKTSAHKAPSSFQSPTNTLVCKDKYSKKTLPCRSLSEPKGGSSAISSSVKRKREFENDRTEFKKTCPVKGGIKLEEPDAQWKNGGCKNIKYRLSSCKEDAAVANSVSALSGTSPRLHLKSSVDQVNKNTLCRTTKHTARRLFHETKIQKTDPSDYVKSNSKTKYLAAAPRKVSSNSSLEENYSKNNCVNTEDSLLAFDFSSQLSLSAREPDQEISNDNLKNRELPPSLVTSEGTDMLGSDTVSPKKPTKGYIGSPVTSSKVIENRIGVLTKCALNTSTDSLTEFSGNLSTESASEDDEPFLSMNAFMPLNSEPPSTPDSNAYSVPNTPLSSGNFTALTTKTNYKNSLARMLKEKEENQRANEIQVKLQNDIEEGRRVLRQMECEDEESTAEENCISEEHRMFLQRFSVTPEGIPDLHPGTEIFDSSKFGKLFRQQTLDLRNCTTQPKNACERILWRSDIQNQIFLTCHGLLKKTGQSEPYQPAIYRWMFQMMSVHNDYITSMQILKSLKDLAVNAAFHIVKNKTKQFEVWIPSVKDVVIVLINMGASFENLFPHQNIQPEFTEDDILQCTNIIAKKTAAEISENDPDFFHEHNLVNVIKYVVLCTSLCPNVYCDQELVLLMSIFCRISLEKEFRQFPMQEIRILLYSLLSNIKNWDIQLPNLFLTLTEYADHHHDLRKLVQLFPSASVRGKQLRHHLSLAIISKLLNKRCTYKCEVSNLQISELRPYLIRMKPSSLLKSLEAAQEGSPNQLSVDTLDHEAYYLAYSLLVLANEVVNIDSLPSNQRRSLVLLCSELDKHIKCDIREHDRHLYRSKVKDLVARIYTKWQELLQKTKPPQGKLHDYWEPLADDQITPTD